MRSVSIWCIYIIDDAKNQKRARCAGTGIIIP